MQWGGCRETLIEQAKEEVEILEYQHPNKFNSLKQELKAYISELESESMLLKQATTTISAATQESSSRNKRKKAASAIDASAGVFRSMKRRCRTDAVLDRAQQCLHKIQHLKISMYSSKYN